MVQQNRWQILVDEVDYARPLKAGQHSIEGRPFKIGLIAFLGDTIAMGRTRRSELSDAMEYAYRHGVPSRYFNGFVKQAGLRKIAKKLKAGHREPGFTGRQNAHASED
ncbi:MAG: hypothetical protein ABT10_22755 [Novosphingobium sp. SCN 63-17]|nr:MAG: hypothetical protein ABT10_22755 [Novosphingobium sp. SCN 63-17]OJX90507.1 MAG: hypothetical protein BGP00_06860 [Novosphingobium sp. 63-713]